MENGDGMLPLVDSTAKFVLGKFMFIEVVAAIAAPRRRNTEGG